MKNNYRLSAKMKLAIWCSPMPQYAYANAIGVDASWLSARLNGQKRVSRDDPRIVKLAKLCNLQVSQCLEEVIPEAETAKIQVAQAAL
jgi:hypothetical protein